MNKETLIEILKCGIKSPSGDNLQPWDVQIHKDYSFTLSVMEDKDDPFDPKQRAAFIAAGTFLENIKIAANYHFFDMVLNMNTNDNSLEIAHVKFKKVKTRNKNQTKLYDTIYRRSCVRDPYNEKSISDFFYEDVKQLKSEFENINQNLIKKENPYMKNIMEILYKGDIVRFFNKAATLSVASNIKLNKKQINEKVGLDYRMLGIPIFANVSARLSCNWTFLNILKTFRFNVIAVVTTKRVIKTSAGIGIIDAPDLSKNSIVRGGMLFERLWLLLTYYQGYLQPYAALPLFNMNLELLGGKVFNQKEKSKIKEIITELFALLKIKKSRRLVMIFRYGMTNKPPKLKSLRKPFKSFIKYD